MKKSIVYTKTGDSGTTALAGGTRITKGDVRLEAYGTIDELNSWVGLLRSYDEVSLEEKQQLITVQQVLFSIGGYLATDFEKSRGMHPCSEDEVVALEKAMDIMHESLKPLTSFVLPGGHFLPAQAHIARTVCRRAERAVIRASENAVFDEIIVKYINRLSDYLFVLARSWSKRNGAEEIKWRQ